MGPDGGVEWSGVEWSGVGWGGVCSPAGKGSCVNAGGCARRGRGCLLTRGFGARCPSHLP